MHRPALREDDGQSGLSRRAFRFALDVARGLLHRQARQNADASRPAAQGRRRGLVRRARCGTMQRLGGGRGTGAQLCDEGGDGDGDDENDEKKCEPLCRRGWWARRGRGWVTANGRELAAAVVVVVVVVVAGAASRAKVRCWR